MMRIGFIYFWCLFNFTDTFTIYTCFRVIAMWPIILRAITLSTITLYLISYTYISKTDDVSMEMAAQSPMSSSLSPEGSLAHAFDVENPKHPTVLRSIWTRLRQLNCPRLVNWQRAEFGVKRALRDGRVTLISDPPNSELDMDCSSIRSRWRFPQATGSRAEAKFPIAFARTVYRDYLMLEQMLSVEYAPQNAYCFALDSKASPLFKERIRTLAGCFPNVVVASKEVSVESNGKGVTRAHLLCLEELLNAHKQWKYAILLQNQDIPLRTNAELVEILEIYNGTNEVGTLRTTPVSVAQEVDWSMDSLQLLKNESSPWPPGEQMHHTKSLNLVALSHAAVDYMVNRLNLDTFIDRLEESSFGMDEVFTSSLNSNLPNFPGGYTWRCLEKHNRTQEGTGRFVIWTLYGRGQEWSPEWGDRCKSGYYRHGVCILGLEQLPLLARVQLFLYANKMLPEFDYGAIFCWLRQLAERRDEDNVSSAVQTGGIRALTATVRINTNFFANLPHVRYNRLRSEGRLDKFRC